ARASRGDRALDDAAGAELSARDRRLAAAADRQGQRDDRRAGQRSARGPQADGEDDEAARKGQVPGAPRPARAEWAGTLRNQEEEDQAQEEDTEVIVWQSS